MRLEAVRIALKRLEEGQTSSFDVIQEQQKLYLSKSRELATIAGARIFAFMTSAYSKCMTARPN